MKPKSLRTAAIPCTVQFSSVAQSYQTLCDPMDWRTPGLPVHHQLPEFTKIPVHWVSDTIQPSHPLSSPSPPALLLLPFGDHRCFLYVCESFCFINKFFCTFFLDFVWYHDICLSLTSLSMIISRSIHTAANGTISFFLWLINIPLNIMTIPKKNKCKKGKMVIWGDLTNSWEKKRS